MIKNKASTTSKITGIFLKISSIPPNPKNEAELESDFHNTHAEHCNRKK